MGVKQPRHVVAGLNGFELGSFDIFLFPQIAADLHRIFDRISKKKSEIRRQNSERRGTFVHGHLLWPKYTIRPAKKDFLLDIDLQEFTKILISTGSLVIFDF